MMSCCRIAIPGPTPLGPANGAAATPFCSLYPPPSALANVPLVMVRRVPVEVLRWDVHGCRDVVAVRTEQSPPRLCVVVTKTLRVLPVQGEDVRPDAAGV